MLQKLNPPKLIRRKREPWDMHLSGNPWRAKASLAALNLTNFVYVPSSPIPVVISQSEIGDASRVRVSGRGLHEGHTFEPAEFIIDTRDAGRW